MYTLECDKINNRLLMSLSGQVDRVIAKKMFFDLVKEIHKLRPGFDIITDLRHYDNGDPKAGYILQKAMDTEREYGVGSIIRVVGGSKNAVIQFETFTEKCTDYTVTYVATMEEALDMLNKRKASKS